MGIICANATADDSKSSSPQVVDNIVEIPELYERPRQGVYHDKLYGTNSTTKS
jgi:hypothetical protein